MLEHPAVAWTAIVFLVFLITVVVTAGYCVVQALWWKAKQREWEFVLIRNEREHQQNLERLEAERQIEEVKCKISSNEMNAYRIRRELAQMQNIGAK